MIISERVIWPKWLTPDCKGEGIYYLQACIKMKPHPQVGFVLWCWREGCGAWLKDFCFWQIIDIEVTVAGWPGPGVKRCWLSDEPQMSSALAVVFETEPLQLCQMHLEFTFHRIPDFWVTMVITPYCYYISRAKILVVTTVNIWIFFFVLHKSLSINTISSFLSQP